MPNIGPDAIDKLLAGDSKCYPVISKGSTTACFENPTEATSSAATGNYHDNLAQTVPEEGFMPDDGFSKI
jgi:hypothetical protein